MDDEKTLYQNFTGDEAIDNDVFIMLKTAQELASAKYPDVVKKQVQDSVDVEQLKKAREKLLKMKVS